MSLKSASQLQSTLSEASLGQKVCYCDQNTASHKNTYNHGCGGGGGGGERVVEMGVDKTGSGQIGKNL